MKKYTANYCYTNHNFVIQNLKERQVKSEQLPVYFILKNLLQRGCPTILSQFLQKKIGKIHERSDFKEPFRLIDPQTPIWHNTIKGDSRNNYFPAKDFFEDLIPKHFGKYAFACNGVNSFILTKHK